MPLLAEHGCRDWGYSGSVQGATFEPRVMKYVAIYTGDWRHWRLGSSSPALVLPSPVREVKGIKNVFAKPIREWLMPPPSFRLPHPRKSNGSTRIYKRDSRANHLDQFLPCCFYIFIFLSSTPRVVSPLRLPGASAIADGYYRGSFHPFRNLTRGILWTDVRHLPSTGYRNGELLATHQENLHLQIPGGRIVICLEYYGCSRQHAKYSIPSSQISMGITQLPCRSI